MICMIILPPILLDGLYYKITVNANDSSLSGAAKQKHNTYIFHTFVMLQLFNQINCRKIGRQDFNVFERMLDWGHNLVFLLIVFGTFLAQVYGCYFFPAF